MHLKSFIIGLFLFCVGGGMLWWVISERQEQEQEAEKYKLKYGSETSEYMKRYEEWMNLPPDEREVLPPGLDMNGDKSSQQIIQERQERLIADMDKLAAGEMTVYPFADEFYGQNWQDKIKEYKNLKEEREFIFNISVGLASTGGLIICWIFLLSFARVLIKLYSKLTNKIFAENKKQEEILEDNDTDTEQKEQVVQDKPDESNDKEHFKNLSNVLVNSGWQYSSSFGAEPKARLRQRKRIPAKNCLLNDNTNNETTKENTNSDTSRNIDNIQQKSSINEKVISKNNTESETIIKHDVDLANTKGEKNHIDNTLKDLTQQVSAIREYAATQQNRLKRFQDGYDWNIIKTFCLRIIRCIDNIENRIENISKEDTKVTHLEEVHDELVFALESSGIEQFEPEINSDYRGQEKSAEAVKEKVQCEDSDKKGKIEKVLKPGYHFFIDENNVKIVRPAQVRLYA